MSDARARQNPPKYARLENQLDVRTDDGIEEVLLLNQDSRVDFMLIESLKQCFHKINPNNKCASVIH